jgi:hypothetical protein
MRRHITRTLLAAAAAGVTVTTLGFTAAGAATAASTSRAGHVFNPPSGGTPIYTRATCRGFKALVIGPTSPLACARSGYQASRRDFRFAQAVIAVPTTNGAFGSPQFYIGLNDGTEGPTSEPNGWAHAGIEPCPVRVGTCPNGWEGFYEVEENGTPGVSVSVPLPGVAGGDGVFFSIYFNSVGNAVRFVVTLPDGTTTAQTVAVNGSIYTAAVAVADWTDFGLGPDAPVANTRLTQFFQGRFTTLSGQQGTFNGPWTLNPVEATSNGLAPPSGTLISAPSFLWTDAKSFMGLTADAFGVWLYNP